MDWPKLDWPKSATTPESGDQVLSLQQMVKVLQSERDAIAKELHEVRGADDQDIRPTVKKQPVSRQVVHVESHGAPSQ